MSDNFETGSSASNPYSAPQGKITDMEQSTGEIASRMSRLGAALIDGIILSVIFFPAVLGFFGGWQSYLALAMQKGLIFQLEIGVFGFLVYILVNSYFLAQNGQTVGKKLVGIKIVRTDGTQPSLAHILLRRQLPIQIMQLVPFVGGLFILVDTLMIFRDSRQCVHDNIADTRVVNV